MHEETPIQKTWRPVLMLTFGTIIFLHMIVFPVITAAWKAFTIDPIPPGMWSLMTVAIGGYVIGRSAEKTMKGRNQQ